MTSSTVDFAKFAPETVTRMKIVTEICDACKDMVVRTFRGVLGGKDLKAYSLEMMISVSM